MNIEIIYISTEPKSICTKNTAHRERPNLKNGTYMLQYTGNIRMLDGNSTVVKSGDVVVYYL